MAAKLQRISPSAFLREPASVGIYVRTLVGLLVTFGLMCVAFLVRAHRHGELPPLPLGGELSFNEKAQFVRGRRGEHFDIIAAGSSVTLNDLSSDALLREMPVHPTIINISAAGMKISETRMWLEHVMRALGKPAVVLTCLSPLDFEPESGWYRGADSYLDDYLAGKWPAQLIFKHFSLAGYMNLSAQMKGFRTTRSDYNSLDFDRDGDVPVEMSYPKVDLTRWNYVRWYGKIEERQYSELDALAAEAASEHILLICVMPPVRAAGKARENSMQVDKYRARVKEILAKNGQILLDLETESTLDDAYFTDFIHMNASGARIFSQELGRRVASLVTVKLSRIPGDGPVQ